MINILKIIIFIIIQTITYEIINKENPIVFLDLIIKEKLKILKLIYLNINYQSQVIIF